ncbi:MAG TPA: CoA transferase [Galbitalea sp.]|jgi:crotonobetainyl-CoA:carnitine CoA-transferase CaiB-like acyl-CoA transferase|nr:CoA transferase [Galbitalea sp.]
MTRDVMGKIAAAPASLLAGIRVLDLSRFVSGPYCTMVLGELGAEIIKVESAVSGDGTRKWGPDRKGTKGPDNPYFMSINRSKRSIAINLGTPAASELLASLVARSDVVIHNFRQDSARKLGVTYEDIRSIKDDIVYCEVSGYGHRGPKSERRALDFVIQAEIGVMQVLGDVDDPPLKVTFPIIDICAANMAAIAIASALIRRDRTGQGAWLSTSLLEAGLASMTNITSELLVAGIEPEKLGTRHQDLAPYEVHASADGYVAIGVATEWQWRKLCALADRADLTADPRFATNAVRSVHRAELDAELRPVVATRTTAEWVKALSEAGVPNAPVATVPEAIRDEQVTAMGIVQEGVHSLHGPLRYVRTPLSVDGVPVAATRLAPQLGAHTKEILHELTDLTDRDIARLGEAGVIGLDPLAAGPPIDSHASQAG